MRRIHVCLVSDQPIPNFTTVLQFKPDTVVLLKTKEMEEKARLFEDVLKRKIMMSGLKQSKHTTLIMSSAQANH